MVDDDGDAVATVVDDRASRPTAPFEDALRWDGRDDDGGASCPTGATACGSRCATRAARSSRRASVRVDTTPPRPRRDVDRPGRRRAGPSCCPNPDGGPATVRFGPALGRPRVALFQHRARPRRGSRSSSACARAPRAGSGTARTAAGARRPGTYLVVLEWRDEAGNIGTLRAAGRAGLPRLPRGAAFPAAAGSPSATSRSSRRRRRSARGRRRDLRRRRAPGALLAGRSAASASQRGPQARHGDPCALPRAGAARRVRRSTCSRSARAAHRTAAPFAVQRAGRERQRRRARRPAG